MTEKCSGVGYLPTSNVGWDADIKRWVAQCPDCGTIQRVGVRDTILSHTPKQALRRSNRSHQTS